MQVLNIGSLNIDYVYKVKHIVKPGETIASSGLSISPGGKGANQSVALAKAGIPVYHAGKIGPDGSWLLDILQKHNVDISRILTGDTRTGNAIIQVAETGENSIVLFGGSNLTISRSDVAAFLNNFGPGDYLLLQNEINNLDYIIRQAAGRKIKIFFNPAPMSDMVKEYPLQLVSSLILNEGEGAELSGITGTPARIFCKLADNYPETEIILTLGGQGVFYKSGHIELKQAAFPVPVVDTTAAGDTFIGFFLAAKLKELPVQKCLELGCRAASLAISKKGALDSIPSLAELSSI